MKVAADTEHLRAEVVERRLPRCKRVCLHREAADEDAHQYIVRPPSAATCCPVRYPAASLRSHTIVSAHSRGDDVRPSGTAERRASCKASGVLPRARAAAARNV